MYFSEFHQFKSVSSLAEEKLPTCSPRFPQLRNILPGIYDLDQGLTKKLAIFHLIFDVAVWIFGTTQTYQISDRSVFINSISLRTRNRGKLNLTIPRKQTPQPRLSSCPKKVLDPDFHLLDPSHSSLVLNRVQTNSRQSCLCSPVM